MIKDKLTLFYVVGLVWTTGVAALGFTSLPAHGWPYIRAHWLAYSPLWVIWGLLPIMFAMIAIGRPLRRFIKTNPPPPDRRVWRERVQLVFAIFLIGVQAFQTIGLVLFWLIPAYRQAIKTGPHLFGYPNPHHWLSLFPVVAVGVLCAWVGNHMPKLQSPFKGRPEPYDWTRMMRDGGRVMTVGSLAAAVAAIVLPYPDDYFVGAALLLVSVIAPLGIWAAYRTLGRPPRLSPPEPMS